LQARGVRHWEPRTSRCRTFLERFEWIVYFPSVYSGIWVWRFWIKWTMIPTGICTRYTCILLEWSEIRKSKLNGLNAEQWLDALSCGRMHAAFALWTANDLRIRVVALRRCVISYHVYRSFVYMRRNHAYAGYCISLFSQA
jgi:hypothetical protein